jgi:hypothetical protein
VAIPADVTSFIRIKIRTALNKAPGWNWFCAWPDPFGIATNLTQGNSYFKIDRRIFVGLAKEKLIAPHLQISNFPVFTDQENLHGPAADFTVHGKPLLLLAGVQREFKFLPTKWTLDFF